MDQFDVCPLRERPEQLVVVIQHDIADDLATRVVAPLSDAAHRRLITRLRIPVELYQGSFVIQIDRLAAVARSELAPAVANLADDERRIKDALDLLFFGV
ncbi:MAG: plasmid maintenance protein CcdB [Bauldia sp.]|nr:MAG: plasmid maintenance protein CcdB [Bauldia sp.]